MLQNNLLLLVAGTGRNSGKTSFVTSICKSMPINKKPVCIKISNHFHQQVGAINLVANSNYNIYEETQITSNKDTAKMLEAGALRVFFIEAADEYIYMAFKEILVLININTPIICESGGLRNYIKPAVFILLHTKGTNAKPKSVPLMAIADRVIESEMGKLNFPSNIVTFTNNKWQINL